MNGIVEWKSHGNFKLIVETRMACLLWISDRGLWRREESASLFESLGHGTQDGDDVGIWGLVTGRNEW